MAAKKPTSVQVIAKANAAKKPTNRASTLSPCGPSGYESVSIRPIDNGYIVSRSTDRGYSEVFSATKPKIEVPKVTTKGRK